MRQSHPGLCAVCHRQPRGFGWFDRELRVSDPRRDPSRKHLSAKVRTFIDFMAEHFTKMDYERKWTQRFGMY